MGKTQHILRLLRSPWDYFNATFDHYYYIYQFWDPGFRELKRRLKKRIRFVEWNRQKHSIAQEIKKKCSKNCLIIVDDLQNQLAQQKDSTLLPCALAHHLDSVIIIS